jgi:hypothetical protein
MLASFRISVGCKPLSPFPVSSPIPSSLQFPLSAFIFLMRFSAVVSSEILVFGRKKARYPFIASRSECGFQNAYGDRIIDLRIP